jgi:hypothetical protein
MGTGATMFRPYAGDTLAACDALARFAALEARTKKDE